MRNMYFVLAFLLSLQGALRAQITSWNLVDTVFCCDGDTWFDIDEDGEDEIRLRVTILTDIGAVIASGMHGTLISAPMPFGSDFNDFEYVRNLAVGGVGCLWTQGFAPGEPSRYIAVLEDTGPDTLWRYIRASMFYLDPTPGNYCKTGIALEEAVYQAMPNVPLFAGEGSTSAILEPGTGPAPQLFPNPTSGIVHLKTDRPVERLKIVSMDGEVVLDFTIHCNRIDLSHLPPGIYLVAMHAGPFISTFKIVRQ